MIKKLKLKVPPPLVMLICIAAMLALDKYAPLLYDFIPYNWPIAGLLLLAGLGFITPAIILFVKAKTTVHPMHPQKSTALVISGVYKITRNPMYVGLWFVLLALATFLNSITPYAIIPLFVLYIEYFQIKAEEEALVILFGEAYAQYLMKVRRWL